ncbi:hypothetical protein, partial [Thermaurantiacus sp.]
NYTDRLVSKHDCFFDGATSSVRASLGEPAATRGYRGHLTQGWQVSWGHLNEGNVEGWRVFIGSGGADLENRGLGCIITPFPTLSGSPSADCLAWPGFTAPAAVADGGAGFGNYLPLASSPLRNRCTSAQIDADRRGRLRLGARWTAGALDAEPDPPPPVPLTPALARHGHDAGQSGLAFRAALLVASARHAFRAIGALAEFVTGGSFRVHGLRTRRVPRDNRRARPARD